jgi:hypothetical protein
MNEKQHSFLAFNCNSCFGTNNSLPYSIPHYTFCKGSIDLYPKRSFFSGNYNNPIGFNYTLALISSDPLDPKIVIRV